MLHPLVMQGEMQGMETAPEAQAAQALEEAQQEPSAQQEAEAVMEVLAELDLEILSVHLEALPMALLLLQLITALEEQAAFALAQMEGLAAELFT